MFCPFPREKVSLTQKNLLNVASSDSQIDKPQRGRPKRAELPDVNINTGAQSINTERLALASVLGPFGVHLRTFTLDPVH